MFCFGKLDPKANTVPVNVFVSIYLSDELQKVLTIYKLTAVIFSAKNHIYQGVHVYCINQVKQNTYQNRTIVI